MNSEIKWQSVVLSSNNKVKYSQSSTLNLKMPAATAKRGGGS